MTSTILVALPGAETFTERLAQAGAFKVGSIETRRFPDGERYLRFLFDPRGQDIELVGDLSQADAKFLTLAFAADTLRELGASHVGLVAPYLGYMRQDARFQPGEAVTSRTFARLLSHAVDRLVTVDPHLHRLKDLGEVYSIPARALHSAGAIGNWIARQVVDPLIIGPDAESEQWVRDVAARARAPFAVLAKERLGDREVRVSLPDLSMHAGRQPVLIDDIVSSGRTLLAANEGLRALSFAPAICVVVHAIFGEDAFARLEPLVSRIVSTDSIAHVSNAISLAPLIAEALGDATRKERTP